MNIITKQIGNNIEVSLMDSPCKTVLTVVNATLTEEKVQYINENIVTLPASDSKKLTMAYLSLFLRKETFEILFPIHKAQPISKNALAFK